MRLSVAVTLGCSLAATACAGGAVREVESSRAALEIVCAPDAVDTPGAITTCERDAHGWRLAYRTTRGDGAPAIATARAMLPPRAGPRPLVVVAHGTVGLADACAPSRSAPDELVRALAARGWPVIAPDYAGLGSEGVQGYGDHEDTARSVLDAARALRALTGEDGPLVLVGHSQGGGAVLSAQSFARRHLGERERIAAVIAIAPGWPVRERLDMLRDPARRFRGGDELSAVVGALFLYAWHARTYGEDRAGDGFAPPVRDALVRAIERGCIGTLLERVPRIAPTLGALVDDDLRRALIACAEHGACDDERAAAWVAWSRANVMSGDPEGAPIHLLQGDHDGITTPARTRCIVDHLNAHGVAPQVCVMDADHLTIVRRGLPHVIAVIEAALAGAAPPGCAVDALPACIHD